MKKFNEFINEEIHSDEDMTKGDNLKDTFLGIDFKGDFKKKRLAIKKLVRLKSQVDDSIKSQIDDIINLIG